MKCYQVFNQQVVIVNEGDTIRLPCFVDDSGELDQNLNHHFE